VIANSDETPRSREGVDSRWFRHVLGHFPTGVVIVTGIDPGGSPVGMAVGSFTSVSLDPPYVAFLPDKRSSTFPRIRASGSFCVNVLSAGQQQICRNFAARGEDRFADVTWRPASSGSPILDGVVAWIDCDIDDVHEVGDHYFVVGRVRELATSSEALPLLFFQGGYGRFTSASLTAPASPDPLGPLRLVDQARPQMERLAAELDVECMASAVVGDELVIVGNARRPGDSAVTSRVGQRMPFVAPLAAPLVAWGSEEDATAWINRVPGIGAEEKSAYARMLDVVRARGWSIGLASERQIALEAAVGAMSVEAPTEAELDAVRRAAIGIPDGYEPADLGNGDLRVRHISAPVFGPGGTALLMLSLYRLPHAVCASDLQVYTRRLCAVAETVTAAFGGARPDDRPGPTSAAAPVGRNAGTGGEDQAKCPPMEEERR
jgi:flavin reductase (DIM6/NTAB) family NADH-FMN oxidoreductase RutF/DNA-binding IclR family transcriptional regulator